MMYPTALVTGGSRGIGKAIVQQLFEQGYNCLLYTSPSPRDRG